jgi:mannose-6-phosphate isomerase-like protein (cupin superfamily)
MTTPFTHRNLAEVEDAARRFGMGDVQEARFAAKELDCEGTGIAFHRLKPNQRNPFGHRHENAEEVYVVLAGSGRAKLDDEIVDLRPLDAIRVQPAVTRAFEAGPDGLEYLAVGPRTPGDGEIIPGWWSD